MRLNPAVTPLKKKKKKKKPLLALTGHEGLVSSAAALWQVTITISVHTITFTFCD
jgi:hypothetical protein